MIPVLCYHRVGPPGAGRKMNVPPDQFRAQMEHLARRCRPVPLDGAGDGAPRGAVAVTFDDGYRDLMAHALPVLRDLGIPATFFIVAGAVGGRDRWYRGEHDLMDWSDLEELRGAGMSLGSHSMTHTRLDRAPGGEARREIVESKRLLEARLGVSVGHFAYPQGRHTEAVRSLVEEAGYLGGWAMRGGPGGPFSRKRLRVSARQGLVRFRLKLVKARLGWY